MLEAKTLITKKSANKSGKVVNFVPEIVDGNEIYSVVNENNDHCGYITEDLFNLLMEQDPRDENSKALIHRAFSVDDGEKEREPLIFGKKIILDVSSTKNIDDLENIILAPVTYTKGAKPLTVKIGTFFTVQNYGELLDINIKSDFIECENFIVLNPTPTKLNIDLNNKSPYFGGIHLYGIENFQNPGGEINLHIKANSKNGYSSINIHQLSIDSEKIGDKNPLHIGFEFGDGVLNASGARINIQSSEKSTKKDYYMIGSATGDVDLGNSEITFLDDGSDKCSYLKAKGLLHAYSSKLSIGETNIVNGDLTYSGNERKKALLILRNFTSYSNLNIKSSADGLFNFIDTTISNGKKIITIEERCNLVNISIENEGKKDLELFSPKIRHSRLKNISSLGRVIISNSDIENLNLKCNNYDSSSALIYYGPESYCQYSDYGEDESLEMICSLKNTTIELGYDEFFNIRTENSVNISNSLIKGHTLIGDIIMGHEQYELSIDNSLLNNLKMTLMKSDLDEIPNLTIKNSELKGVINATGLESVEDSFIASSTLSNIKTINGLMIEDKELDCNSYQQESDEHKKDVGQATNGLELL
jgi:hypothetical protein